MKSAFWIIAILIAAWYFLKKYTVPGGVVSSTISSGPDPNVSSIGAPIWTSQGPTCPLGYAPQQDNSGAWQCVPIASLTPIQTRVFSNAIPNPTAMAQPNTAVPVYNVSTPTAGAPISVAAPAVPGNYYPLSTNTSTGPQTYRQTQSIPQYNTRGGFIGFNVVSRTITIPA